MKILFICNRLPFPPDKGEKIRSFHLIKHLSKKHSISLYSLCDKKEDAVYKENLKEYCSSVNVYRVNPIFSNVRALTYLFTKYPLTFGYFFSNQMKRGVQRALEEETFDIALSYCSSSAQYIIDANKVKRVVDFVDVDSNKWESFARAAKFPFSFIYSLEAKRLKKWEKTINEMCTSSIVVTEREKERLAAIDPSGKDKVHVINNGVDLERFKFQEEAAPKNMLIFTGQMDYLPNVDAVMYFYKEIFPLVKKDIPDASFCIVGRSPADIIRKRCKGATITGYVEDIRDYLNEAKVYVAPLRISHGVQNKILEAMASGVPVVTTSKALEGINAEEEKEIIIADDAKDFASKVIELVKDEGKRKLISKNALEFVKRNHSWETVLSRLDDILEA